MSEFISRRSEHILQLDYDSTTVEDVEIEAKRLQRLCPSLGKYIIKKSSDGIMIATKRGIVGSEGSFHLIFPNARILADLEHTLMIMSRAHAGWLYYSLLEGDTTIRKSKKGRYGIAPFTVKVSEE